MLAVAWGLALGLAVPVYAYVGYPLLLKLLSVGRPRRRLTAFGPQWPLISIVIPVYNEERAIAATLERVLECDYPPDRRQILVVSDASNDNSDRIVEGFAARGVELLRMPVRGGKTAAENAARSHLRGEVVINTDASVRLHPGALKPLVAWLGDPAVGLASGRDVSVARLDDDASFGEAGYVGYEMWVRALETRVCGIVGASGCLYAIRADLHRNLVPEALSRDFAAALIAREYGYRAVSVNDAVCFVPRSGSLRREYHRKVRTMTRGLETLWFKRHLLNPIAYGLFAWALWSHKVVRWLVPWALALVVATLGLASVEVRAARWALGLVLAAALMGAMGWIWPEGRRTPRLLAIPAYLGVGILAGLHAWTNALQGDLNPIWEPTRRDGVASSPGDRAA